MPSVKQQATALLCNASVGLGHPDPKTSLQEGTSPSLLRNNCTDRGWGVWKEARDGLYFPCVPKSAFISVWGLIKGASVCEFGRVLFYFNGKQYACCHSRAGG